MDWVAFFEKTRGAAKVKNFAELAPLIGVTDGAISHYRTGKRLPSAWTLAACLKLQGHPYPEREAAKILKDAAHTSEERAFWRRLSTAAAIAFLCVMSLPAPAKKINRLHDFSGSKTPTNVYYVIQQTINRPVLREQ